MMKSRNFRFVLLNILSTLIEYAIIFCFLYFIFKLSLKVSLISLGILFVIFCFITIFAFIGIQMPSKKSNNEENKDFVIFNEIVENANKKYNLKLKVIFEKVPQPNPAFSIGKTIYINTNFNINADYSCGVIAHEVGHAISGLSNLTAVASLRPSTIFCNLFRLIVMACAAKDTIFTKVIGTIFYVLYILFSLGNLVVLYPFMREDEIIANNYATELGYGAELRVYYSDYIDSDMPKLYKMADNVHPSANLMVDRLTSKLGLKGIEKSLFYCNDNLYNSNVDTLTLTLNNIKVIMSGAIKSEKLKKIKSNSLIEIKPNVLKYIPNLEELNCPKLEKLPIHELAHLNNLKKINVKSTEIYIQIVKCDYLKNKPYYQDIVNKFTLLTDNKEN